MTTMTEADAARAAADALEKLARDLREGKARITHFAEDVNAPGSDTPPDAPIPYGLNVRVERVDTPRDRLMVARVDGITIGPVLGFGVEPVGGGDRVILSLKCMAGYDEVETIARTANLRRQGLRASMIPRGDVDPNGKLG